MPDERDWHNSELDRKWAHWASLVRMDFISVYIRKNCEEPGGGVWEIEEPIFRAGMGLEALYIGRISAWACLRSVPMHPDVSRLYKRLLAASQGMFTIDDMLFSDRELSDCQDQIGMNTATDIMDLKSKTKEFEKVFKPPPRWWTMMGPDRPDGLKASHQAIDDFLALRRVRGKPAALTGINEERLQGVEQALEEARQVLEALKLDHEQQLQRLNNVLAADERELIELYVAAYPDGALTVGQRDTREGVGMVGEDVMQAVLDSVPHTF